MDAHLEYMRNLESRTQLHQQALAACGPTRFVCVVAGLIALHYGFTVIAVMLLVIGGWCHSVFLNERLISEVMSEQHYLAMFIKEQGAEVAAQLSKALKEEKRGV